MKIFNVSTVDVTDSMIKHSVCTVGVFTDYTKALYAIRNNEEDISEDGVNTYCVIEHTESDMVHPQHNKLEWFNWDEIEQEYLPCDPPTGYKKLCNLSVV